MHVYVVCMYIHTCEHTCVHTYIHTYILYMCILHTYCTYTHTHTYMHTCTFMYMYIHVHTTYIQHTHTHIHVHTCTYPLSIPRRFFCLLCSPLLLITHIIRITTTPNTIITMIEPTTPAIIIPGLVSDDG